MSINYKINEIQGFAVVHAYIPKEISETRKDKEEKIRKLVEFQIAEVLRIEIQLIFGSETFLRQRWELETRRFSKTWNSGVSKPRAALGRLTLAQQNGVT